MPVLTVPTGTVEQLGTREVLRSTVDKLAFYLENNAAIDAVALGEAIASIADYAHANNVDLQTLMTTCENNMNLTPTEIRPLKTNVMVDLETLGKPERVVSTESERNYLIPPMKIREFTFSSLSDAV